MKKIFIHALGILTLMLAMGLQVQAQDPQYSQFYSNLLALNPAFAGSAGGPRIAMNFRGQWIKIPGYYQQAAFSMDMPIFPLGTSQGIGINFNADRAGEGDLTKLSLNFNYAYEVELVKREHYIRFGLSGGIIQATIDPFKLVFPDQIDPSCGFCLPTNEPLGEWQTNRVVEDVSAGFVYYNEFAYIGLTANHITQPDETFTRTVGAPGGLETRLPIKYTLTGGLNIPVRSMGSRREVSVTPAFLAKFQEEFFQVDAGLYVNAEPMVFGLWYRHQDAIIGLIGIQYENYRFGVSYDYTTSSLGQGNSGGSVEASLQMEFEQYQRVKKRKHRKMPCPRF
ncbi:MAG: type IX secretion system membrane protein PorP/SprF [Bacteroidota bacterium]